MNRPKFNEMLNQNHEYIELVNSLEESVKRYKENQTKENMEIMSTTHDRKFNLYKKLQKEHQEKYGVFETISEYDYSIVDNPKLPEDQQYKHDMYNRFKAGAFNFKEIKRVKNEYIDDYHKFFVSSWSFHAVKPLRKSPQPGYYDHVKSFGHYYIDKENKILLITA